MPVVQSQTNALSWFTQLRSVELILGCQGGSTLVRENNSGGSNARVLVPLSVVGSFELDKFDFPGLRQYEFSAKRLAQQYLLLDPGC